MPPILPCDFKERFAVFTDQRLVCSDNILTRLERGMHHVAGRRCAAHELHDHIDIGGSRDGDEDDGR